MSQSFLEEIASVGPEKIPWHKRLSFRAFLLIVLLALVLLAGIVAIMSGWGKRVVLEESKKLIEESGNSAVAELNSRLSEIEALARTIAETTMILPRSEESFFRRLPPLINFQNDTAVAGGGFWPEPYQFDSKLERRAFFWGRDSSGKLAYIDDYNQPGPGYHREEWYVVTPSSKQGRCFWSRSYMDPYSYQPMTTCTVGLFSDGRFQGNVTIDVKLEGLAKLAQSWQKKDRGYVFILDRKNKFLTFPKIELVKKVDQDAKGNRTEEFLSVTEFAQMNPQFSPLAKSLEDLNQKIITLAGNMPEHRSKMAELIASRGYDITAEESQIIASIIEDPLKIQTRETKLIHEVQYKEDLITKEESIASIFHVPGAYWKVVVVNPLSQATSVATQFARMMIGFLGFAVILVASVATYFLNAYVINPLSVTRKSIQKVTMKIAHGDFSDLNFREGIELNENKGISQNEIGILQKSFGEMTRQLLIARESLSLQNEELKELNENLKTERAKGIQNAKLASLGEMAAGIAHEINNPTAIINGTLTIMSRSLNNPEEIKKRMKIIEKSVERITKIVGALRKFSRTSNQSTRIILDVVRVIEEAMTITSPKARKHDTHVSYEGESGLKILFNEIEMEQILVNLINNAIDAVKNLKDRWVRLKCYQDNNTVHLLVTDSGDGIPDVVKEKLFQPFFTTKPVGEGTGLGLSIVKGILDAHQASIEVAKNSVHTCFHLRFNRAKDTEGEGESLSQAS